jgi:hypothetical protein
VLLVLKVYVKEVPSLSTWNSQSADTDFAKIHESSPLSRLQPRTSSSSGPCHASSPERKNSPFNIEQVVASVSLLTEDILKSGTQRRYFIPSTLKRKERLLKPKVVAVKAWGFKTAGNSLCLKARELGYSPFNILLITLERGVSITQNTPNSLSGHQHSPFHSLEPSPEPQAHLYTEKFLTPLVYYLLEPKVLPSLLSQIANESRRRKEDHLDQKREHSSRYVPKHVQREDIRAQRGAQQKLTATSTCVYRHLI